MKVVLIEAFNGFLEREYSIEEWQEIEVLFDSVDWTKFHIFSIHYDAGNSMDISGNTSDDGLSASLVRDGKIHIISNAPESLNHSKSILKSFFFNRDASYEKYFKEIKTSSISPKRSQNRFFRLIMVLFFSSIVLVPLIYFSWDDLKFMGREVGFARAKIVDVKMESFGGRFFWQKVQYEFEVKGSIFSGTFKGGKRQGYSNLGDELKVRYLLSDPRENDFVGRFVKKKVRINNTSTKAQKAYFSKGLRSENQMDNTNLDSLNSN